MSNLEDAKLLVIVPARGGSEGMPNKNIEPFDGVPLLTRTLSLATSLEIRKKVVFTSDSDQYLAVAEQVPGVQNLKRPDQLATSLTPMSLVIKHACDEVSEEEDTYDSVLLLDVTNPLRTAAQVIRAVKSLRAAEPAVDGILSVSEPHFNPAWVTVTMGEDMKVTRWNSQGSAFTSRQQAPKLFRMNGLYYIWRFDVAANLEDPWLEKGNYLGIVEPDHQGISIDTEEDFRVAEAVYRAGLFSERG